MLAGVPSSRCLIPPQCVAVQCMGSPVCSTGKYRQACGVLLVYLLCAVVYCGVPQCTVVWRTAGVVDRACGLGVPVPVPVLHRGCPCSRMWVHVWSIGCRCF
jgi:hypothetical protein